MEAIDLKQENEKNKREFVREIKQLDDYTDTHKKFKIGDIIEFYSGYYNHILYRSEIIGFDKQGGIYVLWDCYWFPIKDEPKRKIKIIEDENL